MTKPCKKCRLVCVAAVSLPFPGGETGQAGELGKSRRPVGVSKKLVGRTEEVAV